MVGIVFFAFAIPRTDDLFVVALDWLALPKGSLVVDVGGGIGSTSVMLARGGMKDMGARFIVQDRGAVCKLGEEVCYVSCS